MKRFLFFVSILLVFSACKDNEIGMDKASIEKELNAMKIKLTGETIDLQWKGSKPLAGMFKEANKILNGRRFNPGLKSPCLPPSSTNPTIRYQEFYECSAATVLKPNCLLWEETIKLKKAEDHISQISKEELNLILHKAVNLSDANRPRCSCQKIPSYPYKYELMAQSFPNQEKGTLTKKIWVKTTYNCCGACK